mmetsp:Transcript_54956/g.128519  ORF Transcript_54956/g.128519 Transcript_54956/m.128519 type:complete len:984 (+) Transcript_54956:124-3075(+)
MADPGGVSSRATSASHMLGGTNLPMELENRPRPDTLSSNFQLQDHLPPVKLTLLQHFAGIAEELERLRRLNNQLSNHNAALKMATASAALVEVDGLDRSASLGKRRSFARHDDILVEEDHEQEEVVVDMDLVADGCATESMKVQALAANLAARLPARPSASTSKGDSVEVDDRFSRGQMGSRVSLESVITKSMHTQASKLSVSSIDEATETSRSTGASKKRSTSHSPVASVVRENVGRPAVQHWASIVGTLLRSREGDEVMSPRPTTRSSARLQRPATWSSLAMALGTSPRTDRARRGSAVTETSAVLTKGMSSASREMMGVRSRGSFEPELWPEWLQVNIESAPTISTSPNDWSMYSTTLVGLADSNIKRNGSKSSTATLSWRRRYCKVPTMPPSSPPRLAWDILSLLILGFDAIFIPLGAFGLPDYDFIVGMMWVTSIFWTLDIGATIVTGFHHDGRVELSFKRIFYNYLRTWFIFDFFIIACDWLVLISREQSVDVLGIIRVGKSFRLTRVLRAMRLLRILRILRTVETLWYFATSEIDSMMFAIGKFMVGMLFVNHFVACAWYGVGTIDLGDGSRSWVDAFEDRFGSDAPLGLRYATAFHWSITQMTPASMEVNGQNILERIFTVCIIVMSLILISSIVSSITAAVTQLRKLSFEKSKQQELVRSFIGQKSLSLELGNRIWQFLQKHYTSSVPKRALHEKDVEFFKIMPESLRLSLHVELFLPLILPVPFFESLHIEDPYTVVRMCHIAMSERSLSINQELFSYCDAAKGMYFTLTGTASYFKALTNEKSSPVGPKAQVCVLALWLQWQHRGRLVARSNCEFVLLDSGQFRSVVSQHGSYNYCKIYAELFRDRIVEENNKMEGDINDLWNDVTVELDLVTRAQEDWSTLMAAYTEVEDDDCTRASRRGSQDTESSLNRYWMSPTHRQKPSPTSFAQQVTSWFRTGTPPQPSTPIAPPGPPTPTNHDQRPRLRLVSADVS